MPRCIVGVALAFVFASLDRRVTSKGRDGWCRARPMAVRISKASGRTTAPRRSSGRVSSRTSRDSRTRSSSRSKRRAATLFGPDAEATFGDALYLTLLADTRPAGLGATGSYSQNWLPDRYFEHRTSLIDRSGRRETAAADAGRRQAPCRGRWAVRTGWRLGAGHVAPGSLHSLRLPGSVRRIHGGLPHRADAGVRGDSAGEDPRHPHHSARRSSASVVRDAQLPR